MMGNAKWSTKKNFFFFLGAIVIVILAIIALHFFQESEALRKQADALIALQEPEEAIGFYKRAQAVFPLRFDLSDIISGAQLILQSKGDYDSIRDFAEIQIPPPLATLTTVELKPNELFVPILMYHHIEVNPRPNNTLYAALYVSPKQLDEQLAYFSSHDYHAITLDDMYNTLQGKITLPSNPIILSFDDGYQSFYDNAYPLLKKYNTKAVQFVITQVQNAPAYLSWKEIVEMDKSGLVQMAAHTRHHANLPSLSSKFILDEIVGSKKDLESHLGHSIAWFAYPYGSYNSSIIQVLKNAGFLGAASTIYGATQSKDNIYLMPRIMVDGRFTVDNLARRLQK